MAEARTETKYRPPSHQTYLKCLKAFTWVIIFMLGAGWAIYQKNWGLLLVNISLCMFSALCADYYRQRRQFQLKREAEMSDDE